MYIYQHTLPHVLSFTAREIKNTNLNIYNAILSREDQIYGDNKRVTEKFLEKPKRKWS